MDAILTTSPDAAHAEKTALPSGAAAPGQVWIVVPAYNEGERLAKTLSSLAAFPAQIVVVDDGSADHTHEVAMRFPRAWTLRHPVNCGQGASLQTGMEFALSQGAQVLVTFDADGQHCVEDIERLVRVVASGDADVALGSRFLGATEGMPLSRWMILKLGVLFTRVFSRIRVTDTHNGLRAFSRAAAQRLHITLNRMAHASEILDQIQRLGLRYQEVPVTIRYNTGTLQKGQSSWNSLRIVGQLLLSRIVK